MTCAEHLGCQALEAKPLLEIRSQRAEGLTRAPCWQNHAYYRLGRRVPSRCPKADSPHTRLLKDSSQAISEMSKSLADQFAEFTKFIKCFCRLLIKFITVWIRRINKAYEDFGEQRLQGLWHKSYKHKTFIHSFMFRRPELTL